jgi:hypothetical protein
MRKTSVWVLCGLMGLATAAMAAAQTGGAMGTESGTGSMGSSSGSMSSSGDMSKSTTTKHKSMKKHTTAKAHSVTGEVTAVDATAKTMTVHPKKGADANLSWDDKTVMSPKGAEVKMGDKVTASYKMSGETKMATKVRVHAAKAAAAPAPAASTPK